MINTQYSNYIYVGILTLLMLATILAYHNQQSYTEEVKWVRHSSRVLRALEAVLSTVKDAETGHRGYQLTRDTTFLRPYYQSVSSLDQEIDLLDSLLLDHDKQRIRKDSLKQLLIKQYNIIGSILASEHDSIRHYTSTTYKRNLLIMGKENMDHIRSLVSTMKMTEEETLEVRVQNIHGFGDITPITLLVYGAAALGGATVLFILLLRELRQRRRTENELRLYTEDLKRSNEDLEQFAYVASHDLQEPLRKIRAFGDRLQTNFSEQLGEQGKDYINRMQLAAKRMQRLIDDLLSFSRISRDTNNHDVVDLNVVLDDLREDMETLIEQTGTTFNITTLPAITGNSAQLKRLFQNLISNAIKFRSNDRNPVIHIDVQHVERELLGQYFQSGTAPDEYFRITIQDNGIGFDEKYAEKIFVIFQRLHGRSEYEGTGIGLAICRKIVANHGGFITVNSKEGVGSTFSLYFPEQKIVNT